MECRLWIVLSLLLFVLGCQGIQVPEISQCQHINAAVIKCTWKHAPNGRNLTLFYKKLFESRDCVYQLPSTQREIGKNGEIIETSELPWRLVHSHFDFSLAELSTCENVDGCWHCANVVGNVWRFNGSENNVVLTVPPSNFRIERNSTLLWDQPKLLDSMLGFANQQLGLTYKLEYRRLDCLAVTKQQLNHTWKIWYQGSLKKFTPQYFIPGCQYEAKVYASFMKYADARPRTPNWSNATQTIKIIVPIEEHSAFREKLTTRIPNVKDSSNSAFPDDSSASVQRNILLAVFVVLIAVAVISCFVFRKHFEKFLPTKTSVPKPFLMIPMEEHKSNYKMQWNSDEEAEVAAFLPHLAIRKIKENNRLLNHLPLMNGKSNSFQLMIETNNHTRESQLNRKGNLHVDESNVHLNCNESQSLASTPSTTRIEDVGTMHSHGDNTFGSFDDDNLSPEPFMPVTAKNPLKLATQHLKNHLITDNDETITSDRMVGLPSSSKLDSICDANPDQNDHDSLSPQTTSSGFAEYMDYVTDTSGVPSSSGGVAFFPEDENLDIQSFSEEYSSYLGQISQSNEEPGRCIHNNSEESNLMAFSSLPSVAGEYLTECYDNKPKEGIFYKMLSRSTCPSCRKQFVVKHQLDELKRKSLGGLPSAFGDGKHVIVKNRPANQSTGTLSLDSGYSLDLAVSP